MSGMYGDIVRAVGIVMTKRAVRPEVLRCAVDVAHTLRLDMWSRELGRPPTIATDFTERGPLGMRLVDDKYLPRGVWRLCDADETLLYDCREGKAP